MLRVLFQPNSLRLFSWANHFKAIPIACHSISHNPGASNSPHLWQNSWAASRSLEQQSFWRGFWIRGLQLGSAMLHRLAMFFTDDTPEPLKLPYPKSITHHDNQPPATCCNCCIWRCCSSALPQSQWASGPFWSPRLPVKLCKLYFLFVLTTFCQTSAVHNLQYLVQVHFKVSLNPWNPPKIAGLKVLEMILRFAATLGEPPNGAPSTLLPESSVHTCLLYPFVVIWRTSCGVSNSFIFFRRGTANQKSPRAARRTPRCHQRHRPKKIQKSTLCMLKGRDQVDSVGLSFTFQLTLGTHFWTLYNQKKLINGDSGVKPWECVHWTLATKYWWQDEPTPSPSGLEVTSSAGNSG